MDSMVTSVLAQLVVQTPVLGMYVVGLILALIFWPRCPLAGALAAGGLGLLLLVTVGFALAQIYLFHRTSDSNWSINDHAWRLTVLGLASSVLRAVGLGLLVAAVFVGRGRRRTNQTLVSSPPPPAGDDPHLQDKSSAFRAR